MKIAQSWAGLIVVVLALSTSVGITLGADDESAAAEASDASLAVAGVVRGAEGPIQGATVVAIASTRPDRADTSDEGARDDEYATAETDADGRFELEVPGSGTVTVWGHAPGHGVVLSTEMDPASEIVLELPRPVTLSGEVLAAETGRGIGGARVEAWIEGAGAFVSRGARDLVKTETRSGPRGAYVLEDLTPGLYAIRVTAEDRAAFYQEGRAVGFEDESVARFNVTLSSGTQLAGRVIGPEGDPIEDAVVRAYPDVGMGDVSSLMGWQRSQPRSEKADADGRFLLEGVPSSRRLGVYATAEGFAPTRVRGLSPGADDVVVRMETGHRVSFRVVDHEGRPVETEVGLSIRSAEAGASIGLDRSRISGDDVTALGDGMYEAGPVQSGRQKISFEVEGATPIEMEVAIGGDGVVDLGDVIVPGPPYLEGRVVDDLGDPVAEASVDVMTQGQGFQFQTSAAETDDEGRFRIAGLGEISSARLTARQEGFAPSNVTVTSLEEEAEITLTRSGALRGVVLRPDAEGVAVVPAPSFVVRAIRQKGVDEGAGPFGFAMFSPEDETTEAFAGLADGKFEIDELKPGTYSLEIDAPGCVPARVEEIEIVAEETADVGEVEVELGTTVTGTVVVKETGQPLGGVAVRQVGAGMDMMRRMMRSMTEQPTHVTASSGTFVIPSLPPGSVTLEVSHEGYAPQEISLEIEPGQVVEPVTIEMGPGGSIEGVVRTPQGQIMKGAMVIAMQGMRPDARTISSADERGRYRFDKLAPGGYTVMAMKAPDPDSGEMPGMQGMQMRQVTVEEGDVVRVDFPEGQTTSLLVEGTLMRGDVPVPSAQMMWRPAKLTGLDMQSATTGPDGSFEVTLPKPGEYKIGIMFGELDVVAGRMNTATIEAEVTNDNALGLVVTVPEATLAGSVSDAQTGEALASARVHAFKRQDDGTFEATHMVMADEEGLFEVEALGAGEYAMTIVAPGKAAEVVGPMAVDDDEELDDMDLRLAPSAPLGVRVRSTSGQPLDGMIVFPVVDGDLAVPWTVVTSFTDASGATWVRELPEGIWSLAIVGQGAPITVVEDVEIGRQERTIEVEIGRASTVEISLVDADGNPVPDAELFVAEKEGRDLTWILKNAVVSRRSRIGLTTDEAGRIAVEELGPGTYELRLSAPDGREASDVVRLAEGETVSVDLALD